MAWLWCAIRVAAQENSTVQDASQIDCQSAAWRLNFACQDTGTAPLPSRASLQITFNAKAFYRPPGFAFDIRNDPDFRIVNKQLPSFLLAGSITVFCRRRDSPLRLAQ